MKTQHLSIIRIIVMLAMACWLPSAYAATATISQSGADTGTVMKNTAFTLTVSDLEGSGTAAVTLPSGFTMTEEASKAYSDDEISWTTISANERLTGQSLTVQISTTGSPTTATTDTFNVVTAPSLSLSRSPSSQTVEEGDTFELSLTVQNTGETTARNVIATISLPSGITTADSTTRSLGSIDGGVGGGGGSTAVSWDITASDPSSSSTITLTVTSSNAATKTTTVTVTGPSEGSRNDEPGGGSGGGSSSGGFAFPSVNLTPTPPQGMEAQLSSSEIIKTVDVIPAGELTKVIIGGERVQSLSVQTITTVENAVFHVIELAGKPPLTPAPGDSKVYGYLDISAEGIANTQLHKVEIMFNVPKAWLQTEGVDEDDVILYHWDGLAWQGLPTQRVKGGDGIVVIYSAETSRLSLFAIGTMTENIPQATPIPKKDFEQPGVGQKSQIGKSVLIVGAIAIIIAAVILFVFLSKRKSPQHHS